MKRLIVGWLLVLGMVGSVDNNGACFEDMPCWDCHTMGNQICGEVSQ